MKYKDIAVNIITSNIPTILNSGIAGGFIHVTITESFVASGVNPVFPQQIGFKANYT